MFIVWLSIGCCEVDSYMQINLASTEDILKEVNFRFKFKLVNVRNLIVLKFESSLSFFEMAECC